MSTLFYERLSAMGGRRLTLNPGAYLFHRGDAVTSLFLVEEGVIELTRQQEDGAPAVLQRAGPQSILAEASLYSEVYHCDGSASKPAIVKAIAKSRVLECLKRDSALSELWSSHLAREVQSARVRSEILTRKTVRERLETWLALRGEGLPMRGEWNKLALEIGVSPEALYRELAKRR